LVSGIGFMISSTLYLEGLAHDAAERQVAAILFDLNDTYAKAQGLEPYPVDASLDIMAYWVFTDTNSQNHTLTITSELTYEELDGYGKVINTTTMSTSVQLKMYPDNNNSFDTAKPVPTDTLNSRVYLGGLNDTNDYYKFWANKGQIIHAEMYTPSDAIFYLYLYNTSRQQKDSSEIPVPGVTQAVGVTADSTGYWFIRMKLFPGSAGGFYKFVVNVYWPPDGGGCPTLFVWNGTEYVDEGVLNIHSEPNVDTVVNHTLATTPVKQYFVYTLKLAEIAYGYNFSHSYIDQVKLYVTDYDNVIHESYLIYANHSRYGNVWNQLFFSDDARTETVKNDKIILKFLVPFWVSDAKAFTFRIEGHNWKV